MLPNPADVLTEAAALEAWAGDLDALVLEIFRPAPNMTLSEWADTYGVLAEPQGQRWDTSVTPYLREVMDSVSDRTVREVVVMKAARVGYTQGVLGQRIGQVIDQDPAPVLVVLPTEADAKDWSQKELRKMLEGSDQLKGKVAEKKSRESGNTILDKLFTGGSLTIRGGHSPTKLRRHTSRDVLLDEVDGFELEAGEEGDPVLLAQRANRTYPDRKTLLGSTPKMRGSSRIENALKASDHREYHLPCPHCDELQVLEWGTPETAHGIKWAKRVTCRGCGTEDAERDEERRCVECGADEVDVEHLPETAHYICQHCGEVIEAHDKPDMLAAGKWIPRHPERSVRGYHISGLLSPFEGSSWSEMVRLFLRSRGDRAQLQVWTNQWLGIPFEERGLRADVTALEARAVPFLSPSGERVEVPDGVGILTAGVDVQGDRLELLVRGWGGSRISWDIFHERIWGDPHQTATWARLDALLGRRFQHISGQRLPIAATMIDSGGNEGMTKATYAFVARRQTRNIWASKGDSGHPDNPPLKRSTRKNPDQVKLWTVGTYVLKADLFARLGVQTPGLPGYVYLRAYDPDLCNGFDSEYFAEFAAEERLAVRSKGSHVPQYRWVQKRKRNEAIDLQVLAAAALHSMGQTFVDGLAEYAKHWSEPVPEEPARDPDPGRDEPDGGDWVSGGGRWGSW